MPGYMLLLRDSPTDFEGMSPEEMQTVIQKYTAWRDRLDADGRLIGSEKLRDGEGRVMKRVDGNVRVLDGPYSETNVGSHDLGTADRRVSHELSPL